MAPCSFFHSLLRWLPSLKRGSRRVGSNRATDRSHGKGSRGQRLFEMAPRTSHVSMHVVQRPKRPKAVNPSPAEVAGRKVSTKGQLA